MSNDWGLSCRSPLSGEAVCWPQGHTGVSCLHPCRERKKINSTNNLKKKSLFQWRRGFSESAEEGWGIYLVRCGTRRCRGDRFTQHCRGFICQSSRTKPRKWCTLCTWVTGQIFFVALYNRAYFVWHLLLSLSAPFLSPQCPLQAWWERAPDFLGAQQPEHIFPPSHRGNRDNS